MNRSRETSRRTRLAGGLLAIVLGIGAWAAAPAPAAAQFPFFGWGYPRYYAPYPYYPPPAYYPYYPPPAYYPPAPAAYPAPAPGAGAPVAGGAPAPMATTAPAPTGGAQITYTSRPAFTNAAGETCREFATAQDAGAGSAPIHGTACRDASGQWRVAK
jgi:hypothetical protein